MTLLTEELQAAGIDPTKYPTELKLRACHTGETPMPRQPLSYEPGDMQVAISVTSPLAVIFATQTRRLRLAIEDDPENLNAYRIPEPPPNPLTDPTARIRPPANHNANPRRQGNPMAPTRHPEAAAPLLA
eukprot:jgi/Tetstr1/449567/TSEL_036654.t1